MKKVILEPQRYVAKGAAYNHPIFKPMTAWMVETDELVPPSFSICMTPRAKTNESPCQCGKAVIVWV